MIMTINTFIIDDDTRIIAKEDNGLIKFFVKYAKRKPYASLSLDPSMLPSFTEFVKNVTSQYCQDPLDKIRMITSSVTNVPITEIKSRKRDEDIVMARHIIRQLARKHYTLKAIATRTGYNEATIYNSEKVVGNLIQTHYPELYWGWYTEIKKQLGYED
jgi:hypothetical protein